MIPSPDVGTRDSIDVAPFRPIVEKALSAFRADLGYTEAMVKAAAAINWKRHVWQLRLELRAAEKVARDQCSSERNSCGAVSPCGFGDCHYATPTNQQVVIISTRGRHTRVVDAAYPTYDREQVVASVLAQHRIAG